VQIERRTLPGVHMAFVVYTGPIDGVTSAVPDLLDALRQAGAEPLGPPVAVYPSAQQDPNAIMARVCVPVPDWYQGHGGLRTLTMGPVDVVVAHFHGPHRDIGAAYDAISNWVDDQDLSLAEGVSETFVVGPHDGRPEDEWHTKVAVRIKAPRRED
jgi:effector-binding domain-containing protein